jgi:hypothetical protein
MEKCYMFDAGCGFPFLSSRQAAGLKDCWGIETIVSLAVMTRL